MNPRERNDLIISWLTISLAFAWVLSNLDIFGFAGLRSFGSLIVTLPAALIAVGTAFILHELAHRWLAIRYGCHAEYKMWTGTLLLAILFAFVFGIVFAAPGAVYIYGTHITRKQNGLISLAGPATNAAVAFGFLLLYLAFPNGIISSIAYTGLYVNIFIAAFNLIPVMPLDGAKVFAWSPAVWAAAFAPTAVVLARVMGFF